MGFDVNQWRTIDHGLGTLMWMPSYEVAPGAPVLLRPPP
jgi:hypothetical protein